MTLICFRDGIMASDSGVFIDDTYVGTCEKLFRLANGALYGACGTVDDRRIRALLGEHGSEATHAMLAEAADEDMQAMLVMPNDGNALYVLHVSCEDDGSKSLEFFRMAAAFYALGHGRMMAMGAMAYGASAEQAVETVLPFACYARAPVQSLRVAE
jgi:hypothetical protein